MAKIERPSKKAIRKAFGEYTTSCVVGYEHTAWDVMTIAGMDAVLSIFEDFEGEEMSVIEKFEYMTDADIKELITTYALEH